MTGEENQRTLYDLAGGMRGPDIDAPILKYTFTARIRALGLPILSNTKIEKIDEWGVVYRRDPCLSLGALVSEATEIRDKIHIASTSEAEQLKTAMFHYMSHVSSAFYAIGFSKVAPDVTIECELLARMAVYCSNYMCGTTRLDTFSQKIEELYNQIPGVTT